LEYEVDMIRHDHPGVSFVHAIEILPIVKSLRYDACDLLISQPSRPCCRPVHHSVSFGEGSPASHFLSLNVGPRSIETPSYKHDRLGRIKVRKIAFVVHGAIAGRKAYATPDSGLVE
jgi:hypothetical protein